MAAEAGACSMRPAAATLHLYRKRAGVPRGRYPDAAHAIVETISGSPEPVTLILKVRDGMFTEDADAPNEIAAAVKWRDKQFFAANGGGGKQVTLLMFSEFQNKERFRTGNCKQKEQIS